MPENKIVGYKNIFGFILPEWVDESTIRLLATFLLSATIIFFVLIFVIWLKFGDVDRLKVELKTKETQLMALRASKNGFDKLSEQIPESTQDLILEAVPQNYSPEYAIFNLRKISSEVPGVSIVSYSLPAGVLFDSGDVEKVKKGSDSPVDIVEYKTLLTVNAPVEALLKFIEKVETSLPFAVVSDIGMQEITKISSANSINKDVKMDLEIKYYQATLKQVDVSKVKEITSSDLALVKELSEFTKITSTGDSVGEISPVATGSSGSLFGF